MATLLLFSFNISFSTHHFIALNRIFTIEHYERYEHIQANDTIPSFPKTTPTHTLYTNKVSYNIGQISFQLQCFVFYFIYYVFDINTHACMRAYLIKRINKKKCFASIQLSTLTHADPTATVNTICKCHILPPFYFCFIQSVNSSVIHPQHTHF